MRESLVFGSLKNLGVAPCSDQPLAMDSAGNAGVLPCFDVVSGARLECHCSTITAEGSGEML